jgi:GTP-binding protein
MPGLIEGASAGVGLGHEFLRHIERTQVLVHVLDMTAEDPLANYALIEAELAEFGHGLSEKPSILALNKMDDPDARARAELLQDEVEALGVRVFQISAVTGQGTRELAQQALWMLREAQEAAAVERAEAIPVLTPVAKRTGRFEFFRDADGVAVVEGPTPTWLARTLDLHDREPRNEFFQRLKRMGVHRAMRRLGVAEGEVVRVGDVEVRWEA